MPRTGTSLSSSEGPTASGGEIKPPEAHIMICDDDAELRRLLSTFLHDHGYRVTSATDGRDLARLMRNSAPVDLVILDVMLPGQSGLEICRELRSTSNVPILMLT